MAIEELELHAEHVARGEPGKASFYVAGRRYAVVHLVRGGEVLVASYGIGESPDDALRSARRRYRSEQG